MSDGTDLGSLAIGAGVTGAVGLLIAFVRGLFTRNVSQAEATIAEIRSDQKAILLELRSMHDEQTRQRSDITALGKEVAEAVRAAKAAHDRLDALMTTPPARSRK